ncbi:MAG: carbamoyl-phosphate synthase large subunit [Eubacteriaceae bacterium]|nr:carbamoyl-phosphate synthase large subunit [Eubacteriaceae bacterium]
MPKREDIQRILIIGSGPIVIGQAAEFDYAGTQACMALKEEGYEVILVNSNPATIMTDTSMADKTYMEPLTLEYIAKIIRFERPNAILPGIGGQTGLNLAMQLHRKGVLNECQVELLGTGFDSIETAEDRELFKELCLKIGEPVIPSQITYTTEQALAAAREIGYPVVLRPAFTLGGTGGGFADNDEQLIELINNALKLSPVHQVLVEKSVKGYKEIEFEVMRDATDEAISICGMENVDPVGVHTGDSVVVAPILSLSPQDMNMLKESALKIIRALKIEGGCNVQYALSPDSSDYYVIEVNPRVSRSSALASKASGYPIAKVTAKIAVGLTLKEIKIGERDADFEPQLDYIVTKMPRFPFDKFVSAPNKLGTQMKATGEVMGIGRNLSDSLLKAVRSLETGVNHLYIPALAEKSAEELLEYLNDFRSDGIFAVAQLFRYGANIQTIFKKTMITPLFLEQIKAIVDMEGEIKENKGSKDMLFKAKKAGFSDGYIGWLWEMTPQEVFALRQAMGIKPAYKMITTNEKLGYIPYFYSVYGEENDSAVSQREKIAVVGSGPIRIGQGVEFDYSTVHAVKMLKKNHYEAIIINNNPETVSTDYTTADKLYFEPITYEDVMNLNEFEAPLGFVVTFGGQTAINLAAPLAENGVNLIGTKYEAIDRAENRNTFENMMEALDIPRPRGKAVTHIEEGIDAAGKIGYPVLVRPSFVLGGRAMQIVGDEASLRYYLETAVAIDKDKPVLVDKYISGRELEVDAVCDGVDVFVPGIMEHVERTGVHSGDSISVYPTFSVSDAVKGTILRYTKRLGLEIGIIGLYNIQFIVDKNDNVFVIEVNPRSSRTVPFISKATGYPIADIATNIILGQSLKEQGYFTIYPMEKKRWYVKAPAFSFSKIRGADTYLSPEMKSTGEAIGYDDKLNRAMYKAMQATGMNVANYGTLFVSLADEDKEEALPLVRRFYNLGFNIEATRGTAEYLKKNGIRTRAKAKLSEGSDEILKAIREGYVTYIINTRDIHSVNAESDGNQIRRCAAENDTTMFTALDTVKVLLDVLEEITLLISTIDAK